MNIKHVDTIGQLIDGLKTAYNEGEIKGIAVTFLTPSGYSYFCAENLTYIEKLGLLQAGIDSVNKEANED
jgi:hypothetical protein